MGKYWKEYWGRLKLNRKFTVVICLLVILPISILAGLLFNNMEKNVVSENRNYIQYTMERNKDNIGKNIDSINMTIQFFLNDESLLDILVKNAKHEKKQTEELIVFYKTDIE